MTKTLSLPIRMNFDVTMRIIATMVQHIHRNCKRYLLICCLGVIVTSPVAEENSEILDIDTVAAQFGLTLRAIEPMADVAGWYMAITAHNLNTVYLQPSANLFTQGPMFRRENGQLTPITSDLAAPIRQSLLGSNTTTITYPASDPNKPYQSIYIFTDPTCPYCQQLHRDVQTLNDAQIEVNYLLFVRHGVESQQAQQLNEVWCDADPARAIDTLMNGRRLPTTATCTDDTLVRAQHALGIELGLTGTPFIVLADGRIHSGYGGAERFIAAITAMEG